jgi:hypothetical protein
VRLDGKLDEATWAKAPRYAVNRPEQLVRGGATWPGADKDSFAFRLLWDDQYLYIGAEVTDAEHRQEDIGPGVWRGDALWLYFDTMGDKSRVDVKLTLAQTPQGPQVWDWRGGGFLPGAQLAWSQTETGYRYEAALPFQALGTLAPEAGRKAGFEVGRGAAGGGFMDWTGRDPDSAQNLAPLVLVTEPPQAAAASRQQVQGPGDVALTVAVDGHEVARVEEAVSPDSDYLWLDRITGLPLHLSAGTHTIRLTGSGTDTGRASVVDALMLVPVKQHKVLESPDGRRLELIRHWDGAFTEWLE